MSLGIRSKHLLGATGLPTFRVLGPSDAPPGVHASRAFALDSVVFDGVGASSSATRRCSCSRPAGAQGARPARPVAVAELIKTHNPRVAIVAEEFLGGLPGRFVRGEYAVVHLHDRVVATATSVAAARAENLQQTRR
jgi:hypothetical protein